MGFVTRGARNAFRNVIRTSSIIIILALSMALAITMLLARQAVQTKIEQVKANVGTTIAISPAGAMGFEGGGEPLTSAQLALVATQAHIVQVTQTLRDRLSSENSSLVSAIEAGSLGRRNSRFNGGTAGAGGQTRAFVPPVSALGTNSTSLIEGMKVAMTSGSDIVATSDENVALIGKDLADKNNLQVGSTFTAYGTAVTVKGIFDTGTRFANNAVVLPLTSLQRLSQQPGQITAAAAQVDSLDHIEAATTAVKRILGDKADVTNQQDITRQALEPLEGIKSVTLVSLVGALIAGAVIIFLTMLMIVRERRREIGVYKAIGASNLGIMIQFVSEALVLTLLGALIGVALGALMSNTVTQLLVSSSANSAQLGGGAGAVMRFGGGAARALLGGPQGALRGIQTTVGLDVIGYGLLGALSIAVLGSAMPAFLTAKIRPAEVMRGE